MTKRCRVPIEIGKDYEATVMCDMVDMDHVHVLFGRPWLYDMAALHDGRANTYTFV